MLNEDNKSIVTVIVANDDEKKLKAKFPIYNGFSAFQGYTQVDGNATKTKEEFISYLKGSGSGGISSIECEVALPEIFGNPSFKLKDDAEYEIAFQEDGSLVTSKITLVKEDGSVFNSDDYSVLQSEAMGGGGYPEEFLFMFQPPEEDTTEVELEVMFNQIKLLGFDLDSDGYQHFELFVGTNLKTRDYVFKFKFKYKPEYVIVGGIEDLYVIENHLTPTSTVKIKNLKTEEVVERKFNFKTGLVNNKYGLSKYSAGFSDDDNRLNLTLSINDDGTPQVDNYNGSALLSISSEGEDVPALPFVLIKVNKFTEKNVTVNGDDEAIVNRTNLVDFEKLSFLITDSNKKPVADCPLTFDNYNGHQLVGFSGESGLVEIKRIDFANIPVGYTPDTRTSTELDIKYGNLSFKQSIDLISSLAIASVKFIEKTDGNKYKFEITTAFGDTVETESLRMNINGASYTDFTGPITVELYESHYQNGFMVYINNIALTMVKPTDYA